MAKEFANGKAKVIIEIKDCKPKINDECLNEIVNKIYNKKVAIYCIAGVKESGKSFVLNAMLRYLHHLLKANTTKGKFAKISAICVILS